MPCLDQSAAVQLHRFRGGLPGDALVDIVPALLSVDLYATTPAKHRVARNPSFRSIVFGELNQVGAAIAGAW